MKRSLSRPFLMEYLVAALIVGQVALIIGACFFIFKYGSYALSHGYDVPLVETPREYFGTIAETLRIEPGAIVYDLGSGDGRVILYLARQFPAARFIGIERNPLLIAYSKFKARAVPNASFVRADMFDADFSDATRIYAYLKTAPLNELHARGKLKGVRVVSRAFRLRGLTGEATELSRTPGSHGEHLLHTYDL